MQKKPISSDEIKKRELDILKYVKSVCEENGLRYYLSYGSLLGAIRHGGFIPWDDDIDISMPRPDYERLILFFKKTKSNRFKGLLPDNRNYPYHFIKVVDLQTYIEEKDIIEYDNKGLWIDIFPLDGCSATGKTLFERLASFFQSCRAAATYKVPPSKRAGNKAVWILRKSIGYNIFKKLTIHYSKKLPFENADYVAHVPTSKRYRFPKKLFDDTVDVSFEGELFKAPHDYDAYLSILYGNYMCLPPIDERVSHNIQAFLK